jgi:hypothetical protein
MSATRSELTEIFTTTWLVNRICKHFEVPTGQIEFGCDGLSALSKAFSEVTDTPVDEPSFDLIAAIKHEINVSPIEWTHRHILGHQDDHIHFSDLDVW